MPETATTVFDRDQKVSWYAQQHFKIDEAVDAIFHLPEGAPPREIRLLEVNTLIAEMSPLEAIDFGVDISSDTAHTLLVLDVTPAQWLAVQKRTLALPFGWTLDNAKEILRRGKS